MTFNPQIHVGTVGIIEMSFQVSYARTDIYKYSFFPYTSQEHNFYKFFFFFFFFNSKELSILLQFVNLIYFSYFLICAINSPSDAIFMGKWLILYERSVT